MSNDTSADLPSLLDRLKHAQHALIEDAATSVAVWLA